MKPLWPARLVLLAAALAGLCAAGAGQPPSQASLLRMAKAQPLDVPAQWLDGVTPIEELDTAWIARAPAEVVSSLRARGVVVDELPAAPPGHAYYLVFDASPDEWVRLGETGQAFPGGTSTWLMVAPDTRPRSVIPPRLPFKQVIGPAVGPVVLSPAAIPDAPVPSASAGAAPSAAAAELAALVSEALLTRTVADLEGFVTRYAPTSNCEAAGAYLLDAFRDLGYAAESDYFTVGTTTRFTTRNIVATLPGRADPARVVIVGAHYDSYSDQRDTVAPGADDNASGVAAVMEAARLLAPVPLDFTVRFIAFGAEEVGLLGSQHYAQAARERGEQIVGVINLDMIAYADRLPEDLDIVGNGASSWLAGRMAAAAGMPSVRHVLTTFASDCSPFWQVGVASVCGIEDVSPSNPYYHRTTDRLETLNLDLLAAITRATVSTLVDLAQPVGVVAPPTALVARSHVSASLFLRARTVLLEWQAPAPGASGYNVYRATTSHGAYQRLNTAPVRETSFADALVDARQDLFYVVTAVDGGGRESNLSGEASIRGDLSLRSR
jgi:hypothetical protein